MKETIFKLLSGSQILRDYELAFHDLSGAALNLLSPDPAEQEKVAISHASPFCALLAHTTAGCRLCRKVQADAHNRVSDGRSPYPVYCFAGLREVAVPVIVAGHHEATLLAGEVFVGKAPTKQGFSRTVRQLVKFGIETDLRVLEQSYMHTRVLSQKQFDAMVRLLKVFAEHLSELGSRALNRSESPPAVQEAEKYVAMHAQEHISLTDAAHAAHLSACHFCTVFKNHTGLVFTEYVARVRVEKAKQKLAAPFARITEVAFGSGFESIPHFNRVFKKYTGLSPTAYRASLTVLPADSSSGTAEKYIKKIEIRA